MFVNYEANLLPFFELQHVLEDVVKFYFRTEAGNEYFRCKIPDLHFF